MADIREIVLDTETTGLNPYEGHRIIEIGCVELINREITGRTYHTYINPLRDVPSDSYAIHGISSKFLLDKPLFKDIVNDFLNFLEGGNLIIHNAGFDIGFINYELNLISLKLLNFDNVIDTLTLARRKFPKSPASLDALCQRFNISLENREKHGALIDSELLAQVYIALLEGSQSTLSFAEDVDNIMKTIKAESNFPYRRFQITTQEEKLHKDFVEKIPNSLWKSYNN
ncbi:DNA polymerase III subunit epsilon [Candidatus Jidaibacter acanthamoeba]|uniref:DNA polymerase III subunit epsilon n=1 Tax=Candidatus Jidaibacter acanthamoebae TaxID=86105 RepID=A0A0C1QPB0_9RICK|nr:DNA polymerase III subunit epsilon [Candidatus Jidaibacter acanthamoeba]KIE05878.1 DNA polymerase III subunit epsilon [Candidatus Jidaibacter acanthamoeba]